MPLASSRCWIEELRQLPLPDGYLDYLRLKLRKLSQAWKLRPQVQKLRFLMIANRKSWVFSDRPPFA